MSALAKLDALALLRPDATPLFSDLSLTIGPARYGLVGRNGCGKSSLLRLLAGEPVSATGQVSVPASVRLVEQEIDTGLETVADALGVTRAVATLARLEAGRGSPEDAAQADWTLEARLADGLARVGLPDLDLGRAVQGLSGGERIRLMIARRSSMRPICCFWTNRPTIWTLPGAMRSTGCWKIGAAGSSWPVTTAPCWSGWTGSWN